MLEVNKSTVGAMESAWFRSRQVIDNFRDSAIGKIHKPWLKETPTTSMYFSDVMSDLIGESIESNKPIIRLEPNVFEIVGDIKTILVLRYISPMRLDLIKKGFFQRIIYFVDDDMSSIELEKKLPEDYRRRMTNFKNEIVLPISRIASEVIAPSSHIIDKFKKVQKSILFPALLHEPSDLSHHENLYGQFNIVFNGTRSHLADLNFIVSALKSVLARHPQVRLTTFLGGHAPDGLKNNQTEHLPAMEWNSYRNFINVNKFHLALAPALETQFNRSRSPSRILDNAGFGAVGLYSNREPFSNWIKHGENGMLVSDGPKAWISMIDEMINNRVNTKAIAARGQQLASHLGDRNSVRKFWIDKLGLSL